MPRGSTVRIIVPDGFRGVIKIIVDSQGAEIMQVDDTYIYKIPEHGSLHVKMIVGFDSPHHVEVSDVNGQPIEAAQPGPVGGIALFYLGRTRSKLLLFIGTQAERDSFMQNSLELFE